MISNFIDMNVDALKQLHRCLSLCSATDYVQPLPPFGASMGGHTRHILDHHFVFSKAVNSKRIVYSDRPRMKRTEQEIDAALSLVDAYVKELESLEFKSNINMDVALEIQDLESDTPARSSVGRELQFLASHSIHHVAMIVCQLSQLGISIPKGLGIARSTLEYTQSKREEGASQPCARPA